MIFRHRETRPERLGRSLLLHMPADDIGDGLHETAVRSESNHHLTGSGFLQSVPDPSETMFSPKVVKHCRGDSNPEFINSFVRAC
ncbi:MAG: hypothetical protein GY749_35240 [Desulfobacteraceae bacterium]|nr:hypothetical protein [Desulfobacteraceae bacterium]